MLDARCIPYEGNELWFRLLVLHVYHAGAGNVRSAMALIDTDIKGMPVIQQLWETEARGFRNASQNYSQLALATLIELDRIIIDECKFIYNCPLNEM